MSKDKVDSTVKSTKKKSKKQKGVEVQPTIETIAPTEEIKDNKKDSRIVDKLLQFEKNIEEDLNNSVKKSKLSLKLLFLRFLEWLKSFKK